MKTPSALPECSSKISWGNGWSEFDTNFFVCFGNLEWIYFEFFFLTVLPLPSYFHDVFHWQHFWENVSQMKIPFMLLFFRFYFLWSFFLTSNLELFTVEDFDNEFACPSSALPGSSFKISLLGVFLIVIPYEF